MNTTATSYPHSRLGTEVLVSARADEDLADTVGVDLGILAEIHGECTGKRVDEEI